VDRFYLPLLVIVDHLCQVMLFPFYWMGMTAISNRDEAAAHLTSSIRFLDRGPGNPTFNTSDTALVPQSYIPAKLALENPLCMFGGS